MTGGPRQAESGLLPYLPGLDGLRALAVAAVFAYHADVSWAPGGFLGVDIFFVVSGYLITALLMAEWRRTGGIDLLQFWRRRALRLLPALVVMLVAVGLAVPLLAPEQAGRITGDVRAALTYVSNWRLIFEHQSYFEAIGRAPLLQHLWSLAVEEQFYLLWPLVLPLMLRRRLGPRRMATWLMGGAVVSALLMAVLYTPSADPSRAYYGTDTRLAAILVGAALACVWAPWRIPRPTARSAGFFLKGVLVASVAGLGLIVTNVDRYDSRLYRGGFLGVALLSAIAVAVAVHPAGLTSTTLLTSRPLLWLGRRSYGIYLWHWPVLSVTRARLDVPLDGPALLALRAGLTLALAAASYRLVEMPVRSGALGRLWRELRRARWARRTSFPTLATRASGLTLVLCGLLVASTAHRPVPAMHDLGAASVISLPELVPLAGAAAVSLSPLPAEPGSAPGAASVVPTLPPSPDTTVPVTVVPASTPAASPTEAPPPPAAVAPGPVTAIGDSVLLAAKPQLEASVPGIYVDAVIGRQIDELVELARRLHDEGRLGPVVVVQAGNNGPVSEGDLDRLLDVLADVPKVVVVNVEVPRPWESSNNEHMATVVAKRPNARLLDWNATAAGARGIFYKDGTHLRPQGIALYCQLIVSAL